MFLALNPIRSGDPGNYITSMVAGWNVNTNNSGHTSISEFKWAIHISKNGVIVWPFEYKGCLSIIFTLHAHAIHDLEELILHEYSGQPVMLFNKSKLLYFRIFCFFIIKLAQRFDSTALNSRLFLNSINACSMCVTMWKIRSCLVGYPVYLRFHWSRKVRIFMYYAQISQMIRHNIVRFILNGNENWSYCK